MCENSGSGTGELITYHCVLMPIRYAYAFKVFCWIYVRWFRLLTYILWWKSAYYDFVFYITRSRRPRSQCYIKRMRNVNKCARDLIYCGVRQSHHFNDELWRSHKLRRKSLAINWNVLVFRTWSASILSISTEKALHYAIFCRISYICPADDRASDRTP